MQSRLTALPRVSPRGFTLVELLVVIAIIGILVVLMGYYTWSTDGTLGLLRGTDPPVYMTGVSFQRSQVRTQHLTDGTSKTYLCGERYMNADHYDTGRHAGDNETWCTGATNDNSRSSLDLPRTDGSGLGPNGEASRDDGDHIFDSAHPSVWHVAWCDGHVEAISYEIDPIVHKAHANRSDGMVTLRTELPATGTSRWLGHDMSSSTLFFWEVQP